MRTCHLILKGTAFSMACCSLPGTAAAQTAAPDSSLYCNAAGTLYYNNGIKTKYEEARIALTRIKSYLAPSLTADERAGLTYELAYNETAGAVADIWEAYKQRYGLQNVRLLQFLEVLSGLTTTTQDVHDFLRDEIAKRVTAQRVNSADLGKFVALYKNAIGSGRKVLVLAHSQGNFFANQSYLALSVIEKRSFAIVSAANPDTQVADGGPYFTLYEDLVIQSLRVLGLRPLDSNTTNGLLNVDPFGHGFVDAYYFFRQLYI